ncbi:MAG: adenosylcobinamide-phosphate synthase CbiB [Anaerolineaceae bacterium]|nr:adenosylcobinamide-phosphate synthase CbiB [Anaerolineaceae bacterium]
MQVAFAAMLIAFAIDILLGDPPNRFHPVVAMGSFIRWLTLKWNQGGSRRRFWAGAGLMVIGGALFSLPWLALSLLWQGLPWWGQAALIGILLKPVFAFRGLLRAGKEVQQALKDGNLGKARRLVSWHLVSRDTSQLSSAQAASATIESLAENLTDSFLAPLFFFAIGGLPLAWLYRFVNTADAMIAYHTPEFEYFGKFAARLDDVLNWIPARLAGLFLVISAALCGLDGIGAFRVMIDQHDRTSSPNAGWTMAAAAGALGVILEKTGHYCLQGGQKLPGIKEIGRARTLVTVSLLISLLACGGILFGIGFSF